MGRRPALGLLSQPGRSHLPGERLGPYLGQGRGGHPGGKDQDLAEAASILERQLQPAFQLKHQVNVGQGRGGGRPGQQVAGHAQMDEQGDAAFQIEQEVFAPAAQALEAPPQDPAAELGGGGLLPQAFGSHLDGQKPAPHEHGGQTPADDFHLRQFRHGRYPARRRERRNRAAAGDMAGSWVSGENLGWLRADMGGPEYEAGHGLEPVAVMRGPA